MALEVFVSLKKIVLYLCCSEDRSDLVKVVDWPVALEQAAGLGTRSVPEWAWAPFRIPSENTASISSLTQSTLFQMFNFTFFSFKL